MYRRYKFNDDDNQQFKRKPQSTFDQETTGHTWDISNKKHKDTINAFIIKLNAM